MKIVGTVKEVREQVKEWKKQGLSVGFVPTMGYLHEGHKSLMDAARKGNDKVVVSIFVNPMQFGPTEDLATYPRDLDHDAALCESVGVDLIFHPEAEEMYEKDFCSFVDMTGLTEGLCGKTRPIHFRGVCTVVNKLFNNTGIKALCNPNKTINCQKAPNKIPPNIGLNPNIDTTAVDNQLETVFMTGPIASQLSGTVIIKTITGTIINCNIVGIIFLAKYSIFAAINEAKIIGNKV